MMSEVGASYHTGPHPITPQPPASGCTTSVHHGGPFVAQRFLFADAFTEPKRKPKAAETPRCRLCGQGKPLPPKPRSVMPLTHALENVRGIMIGRLDDALGDLTRIALEEAGEHVTDTGTAELIALRFIQRVQVRLFPEEFGPGPDYTPDPAGRMDVPVNPVGLVPRHPLVSVYARHLLEQGKQSPIAGLTAADGSPLFTDADLRRLAERQAGR